MVSFFWKSTGLLVLAAGLGMSIAAQGVPNNLPTPTPTPSFSESQPYAETVAPGPETAKPKKEPKPKPPKPGATPVVIDPNAPVELQVAVIDNSGQMVKGLRQADFTVFIDGGEQELVSFAADERPLNIVFLIDTSPSNLFAINAIQEFLNREIAHLRLTDVVSIVAFNMEVKVLIESSTDRTAIAKAIDKLKYDDGTSLYDTVGDTLNKKIGWRDGVPTVVLVTDGVDTASRRFNRSTSLVAARGGGVPFFVLYVDNFTDYTKRAQPVLMPGHHPVYGVPPLAGGTKEDFLAGRRYLVDLYSLTGGIGFQFEPRSSALLNIGDMLRMRYTLTFKHPPPILGQLREIKIRVARPYLKIISRPVLID